MSGDEDDYLSDKFLVQPESAPSSSKTYQQRRKEALKQSALKNEQNRLKSRREREAEAREEGLSKSLFERAKEEEAAGLASGNKALSMMMKMGFKPGQSLGQTNHERPASSTSSPAPNDVHAEPSAPKAIHKTEPLPLNEWAGKQGIGLGKRARAMALTSADRVAKMRKMEGDSKQLDFRDRARQEYQERRAEGQIAAAQRTCLTLDEKAGKTFSVLWLNPADPESFPPDLLEALAGQMYSGFAVKSTSAMTQGDSIENRLRRQIKEDALQPLVAGDDDEPAGPAPVAKQEYSQEVIAEAAQFLRLTAQARLQLVLSHLRDTYAYCFWCGTQYSDDDEMETQCPGPEEEAHD